MDLASDMLLIVDEERAARATAAGFLARGTVVHMASDYQDALDIARMHRPSLALVELQIPGGQGLSLLEELRTLVAGMRVVIYTAYASVATAVHAMRRGATGYLPKPAEHRALVRAFFPAGDAPQPPAPCTPSLARIEWEHIHRVLGDCDGNISEAARRLGIFRQSLQRKLRRYAPPW